MATSAHISNNHTNIQVFFLDSMEFGWTQGFGDGQGGLACCGSWGRKELDMTERLN